MSYTALIVDDEPIARRGMKGLLRPETDFTLIGEAGDGEEAARLIIRAKPDIVFLDIQMPELDGFGVIDAIGTENLPLVVFVTAYDEYALKAFRVHAIDYLLKPVKQEQFRECLVHARALMEARSRKPYEKKIREALDDLAPHRKPLDRFVVRSVRNITFVDQADVDWIEAYGDYIRLHAGSRRHVIRQTMGELERALDPAQFMRIHRSAIVRLDRIKELTPQTNGDYSVLLRTGEKIMLSRTYRAKLFEALRMNT